MNTITVTPDNWDTFFGRLQTNRLYLFEPGLYKEITITPQASGSTFQSRVPLAAEIVSTGPGVDIKPGTSDVTVSAFRVCAPRGMGVRSSGQKNIRIERCWVSKCGSSGVYGLHHSFQVANCLIEGCGSDPVHDHGVYIGNKPMCVVDSCVIRNNAGLGIAPTMGSIQLSIRNNLVHGNGAGGISWQVCSISSGKPAELVNNTIMDNGNNPDIRLSETGTSPVTCLLKSGNIYRRIQWDGTVNAKESSERRLDFGSSLNGYYQSEDSHGWNVAKIERKDAYCSDVATLAAYPILLIGGK